MENNKDSLLEMYILGALVRFWLATSEYQKIIANRIEISTPINSWKRFVEGLHLESLKINPYTGDAFHEPPLYLAAYRILVETSGDNLPLVFILSDMATAFLLYLFAGKYTTRLQNSQEENQERYVKSGDKPIKDFFVLPKYVAAAYLFNPYIIFSCVGFTTTVFDNLFTALFLTGLIHGNLLVTTASLAVCLSKNLYFVPLISPMLIEFSSSRPFKVTKKAIIAVLMVPIFWALLLFCSYYIDNSWNFLDNTYGFVLSVPDLRPNIGLCWYFFTELFEHFRSFFLCAFHINAIFLYLIPLSIRFRRDPMLLAASFITLLTIFKPYPCLGDVGFVLALLCCWKHLSAYAKQGFLVACSFCVTTALAPTVWHLWIYSRSANANFYFGVTLAFGATLVFVVTDLLFAYVKREFYLVHGAVLKIDGQEAKPALS